MMEGASSKAVTSILTENAKEGAQSQPENKPNSTRKTNSVRVIKSRFREAAARVATESTANNSSAGNKTSLISSGCKQRPAATAAGKRSGTMPSVAQSLAKNKLFASTLGLNNSNNKTITNSSRINSNDSSSSNSSLKRSASFNHKHSISSSGGSINISNKSGNSSADSKSTGNNNSSSSHNVGSSSSSSHKWGAPPPPTVSSSSISTKLHSTAVNATMLNTTALPGNTSQFSSTVLSQPRGGRVFSNSFPDLPDISAIKIDTFTPPISGAAGTFELGGPSSGMERVHSPTCVGIQEEEEVRELSQEDLDLCYLHYLAWVHLDVSAAAAHAATLESTTKELLFLQDLVHGKQQEASELRQKLQLLQVLQEAHEAHDALVPVLQRLNDGGSSNRWCEALQSLAHQLEHHLHQVTLTPAVLADTAEEVTGPLRAITNTVRAVLQLLPSCTEHLQTATTVLHDSALLQQCGHDVQEAACLALQKCSLQLTPSPEEGSAQQCSS